VGSVAAQPADAVTGVLKRAGITEQIGNPLALDATFLDENGDSVVVGDYFDGERPVALTFVYHECPMLCSLVLEGLTKAMREIEWTLGDEYRGLTVSISPSESPEQARRQKERYLKRLSERADGEAWAFLTGEKDQIAALTASAGFDFEKDADSGEYGHAATVILVSPEGVVTRYLYGISYAPFDLRAGLIEASEGRVGSIADRLIMFCFQYDPVEGSYVPHAWLAMRLAGGLTLVLLAGFLAVMWKREKRNSRTDVEEVESERLG
jgi:protein SCO1/2